MTRGTDAKADFHIHTSYFLLWGQTGVNRRSSMSIPYYITISRGSAMQTKLKGATTIESGPPYIVIFWKVLYFVK